MDGMGMLAPNLAMSIHVRRQNLSVEALVYIDTLLAETLSIVVILGKVRVQYLVWEEETTI